MAEQTWKPLLKAKFKARREAARKKKVSFAGKSDEEGGDIASSGDSSSKSRISSVVAFDFDEFFHSPQMIAHGNAFQINKKAFRNRLSVKGKGLSVKRLLSVKGRHSSRHLRSRAQSNRASTGTGSIFRSRRHS